MRTKSFLFAIFVCIRWCSIEIEISCKLQAVIKTSINENESVNDFVMMLRTQAINFDTLFFNTVSALFHAVAQSN